MTQNIAYWALTCSVYIYVQLKNSNFLGVKLLCILGLPIFYARPTACSSCSRSGTLSLRFAQLRNGLASSTKKVTQRSVLGSSDTHHDISSKQTARRSSQLPLRHLFTMTSATMFSLASWRVCMRAASSRNPRAVYGGALSTARDVSS